MITQLHKSINAAGWTLYVSLKAGKDRDEYYNTDNSADIWGIGIKIHIARLEER